MTTARKDFGFKIVWPPPISTHHPAGLSGDVEIAVYRKRFGLRFRGVNQGVGGDRAIPHLERWLQQQIAAYHTDGRKVDRTLQGVRNLKAGRGKNRARAGELKEEVLRLAQREAHRGCNLASFIARRLGLSATHVRNILKKRGKPQKANARE